jgi:hypothetical protein
MALSQTIHNHTALRCALAGLLLPGSLIAAVLVLLISSQIGLDLGDALGPIIGAAFVFLFVAAGGALWGQALARIAGVTPARRLMIAGAISHGVMTVLAIIVLGRLEVEFVERGRTTLPLHVLYSLLFVPATFIGAFVVGGALGLAMGNWQLAGRMALVGGLAAAVAFLALNVLQDLLGRRVGGPNAAATATMITVTLLCNVGAAMAMSAVIGTILSRRRGSE